MKAAAHSVTESSLLPDALLRHLQESVRGLFGRSTGVNEQFDFRRIYRHGIALMGIKRCGQKEDLAHLIHDEFGQNAAKTLEFDRWNRHLQHYLFGERRTLSPVAHLVIQAFLGISFKDSMEFASGRIWKCANPITNCGPVLVGKKLRRRARTEKVACNKCGFVAKVDGKAPLGTKPATYSVVSCGKDFSDYLSSAFEGGRAMKCICEETGFPYRRIQKLLRGLGYNVGKPRDKEMLAACARAAVKS